MHLFGLDPSASAVVLAAIIAAGATMIVGVTGLAASVSIARLSSRASTVNTTLQLRADHARRLWERRADTYVEILSHMVQRSAVRIDVANNYVLKNQAMGRLGGPIPQTTIGSLVAPFNPENRFELDARVRAFASNEVYEAFVRATGANMMIGTAMAHHFNLVRVTPVDDIGRPQPTDELTESGKNLQEKFTEGGATDRMLEEIIRSELHGHEEDKPQPAKQR